MERNDSNDSKSKTDRESAAGDFVIGLVLLALSVFVALESLRMPQKGTWGFFMGPGFLPLILSLVLMFLSISLLIPSVAAKGPSGIGPLFQKVRGGLESRRFLVIAGWTAVYVALIGSLPFLVINFIYFFGIFLYLKVGKIWKIILLSLGSAFLVGYAVPWIFDMPVP